MKNKLLIIGLFFIISSCTQKNAVNSNSSKEKTDSIAYYLDRASNKNLNDQQRTTSLNKAYFNVKEEQNTFTSRSNLNKIASQFYYLKQDKELRQAVNLVIERSSSANDSINVGRAYNTLGNYHLDTQLNDSAYFYFLKAEKMFSRTKDSLDLGKNYIDKAFVQLYESDYSGCELSCIQALNYYKNSNQWQKQYEAYNLIGISSNELKNFDNALIYHSKALDFVNRYPVISTSKIHFGASTYNNIGYVYQNLNKHKEAIVNFKKGLSEKDLLKDNPYVYSAIVDNLAYSKFKLKDFSDLPKLFYESLTIKRENNLISGIVASNLHLSEFYSATGDTIKAQGVASEALMLSKKTKIAGDLLGSLKQLSNVDRKNAAKYSSEYIRITDSLQTQERIAKDKFARIAYETDAIITEKDKLAEQNRNLLYIFGTILLFGLLLYVIRYQRAKNRELLLIQAQQKANEDIYSLMISQQANIEESRVKEKKRIAQELHDGVLGRLFGARLNLDSLNKFSDEDSIASRYNYLNELKNIEQDIREISHDLNREKYVLINNFLAIVNNLLEDQKNSYPSSVSSVIDEEIRWEQVNNNIKINLYRILQESLQNINKYAKAKKINIIIKKLDNKIVLNVSDDGIGFNPNTRKKGIGLENMQARANECNGTLEIKSNNGSGTVIMVELPTES